MQWDSLRLHNIIHFYHPVARSPLYSHISTTLQGLPTIRTFRKQSTAIDALHRYQNKHTQGWYLYLVSTRWFGMRIDTCSAVFLAAVAFISIPLSTSMLYSSCNSGRNTIDNIPWASMYFGLQVWMLAWLASHWPTLYHLLECSSSVSDWVQKLRILWVEMHGW